MRNEQILTFQHYNGNDDALLTKIIGYLNAIAETSQDNTLSMRVLLLQINNIQPLNPIENTINNTIAIHAQMQMNLQNFMRDWETREIQEDAKKLWPLYNAGVRLLCLCALAGAATAFFYGIQHLGIAMLLVGPILALVCFHSFVLFLDGIDFKPKKGVEMADSNHSSDSEKYFNKKREALNDYILNATSESPSENIVNKVESKIVRASVLTHYRSNAYTSYSGYRDGRQLLSKIVAPREPMVNVKLLTTEIQRLKSTRS